MNSWCGIGRLTLSPELRYTANTNKAYCRFSLAVSGRGDKVDFVNITVWGKAAEFAVKYFEKGQRVAVREIGRAHV